MPRTMKPTADPALTTQAGKPSRLKRIVRSISIGPTGEWEEIVERGAAARQNESYANRSRRKLSASGVPSADGVPHVTIAHHRGVARVGEQCQGLSERSSFQQTPSICRNRPCTPAISRANQAYQRIVELTKSRPATTTTHQMTEPAMAMDSARGRYLGQSKRYVRQVCVEFLRTFELWLSSRTPPFHL